MGTGVVCTCGNSIKNVPVFLFDCSVFCCDICSRNTPAGLANAASRVKTVEDLTAPKTCSDPNCTGNKTVGDFAYYGTTNIIRKPCCMKCETRKKREYEERRKSRRMMEAVK